MDPAPTPSALRRLAETALAESRFRARPLSWVAESGEYFLKIPRRGDSIERDRRDATMQAKALREARLANRLYEMAPSFCRPGWAVPDYACVVKPLIKGRDLIDELRGEMDTELVQKAATQGLMTIASVHSVDPADCPDLEFHDYSLDPYLAVPEALREQILQAPRTPVVRGFEVRNLMRDQGAALWFLDPHGLFLGIPEEDITRYLLSLLMINWGRHARIRIWDRFDVRRMLQTYSSARGTPLSPMHLTYTMDLNIAIRQSHALQMLKAMPAMTRTVGRVYYFLYFAQITAWRRRNGI